MKKNSFETQILHTPFEKEDAYHSLSHAGISYCCL